MHHAICKKTNMELLSHFLFYSYLPRILLLRSEKFCSITQLASLWLNMRVLFKTAQTFSFDGHSGHGQPPLNGIGLEIV